MAALCILAAGKMTVLAASLFSLSWTHSVQKTEWREDWQVSSTGIFLTEARVKGSGAGMDPPEGSKFVEGRWVYQPKLPSQEKLVLASSGMTGGGWRLCTPDTCLDLGADAGDPVEISICK